LHLKHLSVRRFRNILEAEVTLSARISIFVGKNGQGKTSLLEAAYLLGQNRSFRTNRTSEVQSRLAGEGETQVGGVVQTDIGEKLLNFSFVNGRRQVFLNSNRVTAAEDFFGTIKVIDFTPDDLSIVRGAPVERRGFLDKILAASDREYLASLVRYTRALKNRNALLVGDGRNIREQLSPWEKTLIEEGIEIATKRNQLIRVIGESAHQIYRGLLEADTAEKIELSYESHFLTLNSPETIYDQSLAKDLRLKTTTAGIHRDELHIVFNTGFGPRPAKEIASQGQTRSAALSLKLAGVEYLKHHGAPGNPIVLLDDVESELDLGRRARLLEYLMTLTSQILIATTDRKALPGIKDSEAEFFVVEMGAIS
jgi:DNA replication and repair protein RecF